jgi:ABC-2 type transport system permease protein
MLSVNPIIVKELRSRMRGGRTSIILSVFLIGLAGMCYAVLRVYEAQARIGSPLVSAHVGKGLFAALALAEVLLVTFLTPAVTAGAISSEREQLTYDLLVATPLRPGRILSGKLVATLSYVLLLIFTAIPLGSLVLIFGGVAPRDLLEALLLLVVTAFTFGMIGLFCSSIVRRTITATILAYAIVLLLVIGSFFVVTLRMAANPNQQMGRSRIVAASPFSAMFSIVVRASADGAVVPRGPSPIMDSAGMMMSLPGINTLATGVVEYGPNGPITYPIYRWTIVLYSLGGLVCYWLTSHLVRPRRRWRLDRHDLVMFVTLVAASVGGSYWLGAWGELARRIGVG